MIFKFSKSGKFGNENRIKITELIFASGDDTLTLREKLHILHYKPLSHFEHGSSNTCLELGKAELNCFQVLKHKGNKYH